MATMETKQRGRRAHLAVVGDSQIPNALAVKEPAYPVNVIAIWGPAGSPGKSTLATNVAAELALAGQKVLLVDLDTLAPSLALGLGLVDTPAGLSACLRLAEHVVVDLSQATVFKPNLFHPSSLAASEYSRDTLLKSVLAKAAKVVMVSGCDPVAAQRFLVAKEFIAEISQSIDPLVAVNRFRTNALGSRAKQELIETYLNLAQLRIDAFIPEDRENIDKAMLNGLPLALLKRSSPARLAIAELAKQLLVSSPSRRSVAKL